MRKNDLTLTVEERIRAVLHLKTMENQEKSSSVSEVCRLAEVSRATLYQHHPALLAEIRSKIAVKAKKKKVVDESKAKPKLADTHLKALLYLCLELQMEVRSLKAINSTGSKKNRS